MNTTETTANANTADKAATVAAQAVNVAPEKAASKKGASQKKGAPKGQKAAKGAKTRTAPPKKTKAGKKTAKPAQVKKAGTPRAESKTAKILEMIGRGKGASLAEIMKAPAGRHTRSGASSPPRARSTASRSNPRRMRRAIASTSYVVHHIACSMRSTLLCGVGGVQRGTAAETEGFRSA
jgi:hypothetical protein